MTREPLSRAQIVSAAMDILDSGGLGALNMRELGRQLGSAATAVYWHVGSKDNLIALAADEAWSEVSTTAPDSGHWRAAATHLATSLQSMLTRHPWLIRSMGTVPSVGLSKAQHDERLLAVVEASGLPDELVDAAAAALFTFVLGSAIGPAAAWAHAQLTPEDEAHKPADMKGSSPCPPSLAEPLHEALPRLTARAHSPAARGFAAPSKAFEFGLDALLDRIELLGGPASG